MQEFIDQKKEMFHAELAYKNVQNEIANLTSKQKARDTALQSSKEELNNDHSALLAFIAGDNKEKKDKELKEKLAIAKRQEKDDKIK
jgi:fatty acid-binding protein DegV